MSIKDHVQNAIKDAMKAKDAPRLDALRMAKGALLLKEKAKPKDAGLTDEEAVAALRGEVRKRIDSIEVFRGLGKDEEVVKLEAEIAVIESFLPQQLTPEQIEAKVRAYLEEHPDMNHAGKLTGALKKELGDQADGKTLNEVCRKVLGA